MRSSIFNLLCRFDLISTFNMTAYYKPESFDFLCSLPKDGGIQKCTPNAISYSCAVSGNDLNTTCKLSAKYYNECRQDGPNPFYDTMSFDNIALAWVFIYQVTNRFGVLNIIKFFLRQFFFMLSINLRKRLASLHCYNIGFSVQ